MSNARTFVTGIAAATILAIGVPAAGAEKIADYTGAQAYQRFCASCHGKTGTGDGPVAASLKVQVPDLTTLSRRRAGQFPVALVRRVIDGTEIKAPHGTREMPVWGREFYAAQGADEEARWATAGLLDRLVDYVASIQK